MRYGFLLGLLTGLTTSLVAGPALASHYAVADVPSLIKEADATKLSKAGVTTTEELLQQTARLKDRKALAKTSGLPVATLTDLARRCDLLRIKGIGPEMVLLLEASGVKTTAELSKKDAAALTTTADQANKVKKITEKPPAETQFQDWIEQAKKLAPLIEGK